MVDVRNKLYELPVCDKLAVQDGRCMDCFRKKRRDAVSPLKPSRRLMNTGSYIQGQPPMEGSYRGSRRSRRPPRPHRRRGQHRCWRRAIGCSHEGRQEEGGAGGTAAMDRVVSPGSETESAQAAFQRAPVESGQTTPSCPPSAGAAGDGADDSYNDVAAAGRDGGGRRSGHALSVDRDPASATSSDAGGAASSGDTTTSARGSGKRRLAATGADHEQEEEEDGEGHTNKHPKTDHGPGRAPPRGTVGGRGEEG